MKSVIQYCNRLVLTKGGYKVSIFSRMRNLLGEYNRFWIGRLDLLPPLQLKSIMTEHDKWLELAPFPSGLRISSLPLWLTWSWFTNHSLLRTTYEWRMKNPSLLLCTATNIISGNHGDVCCSSIETETHFVSSRSPGIHIPIEMCMNFIATFWFPQAYSLLRKLV